MLIYIFSDEPLFVLYTLKQQTKIVSAVWIFVVLLG